MNVLVRDSSVAVTNRKETFPDYSDGLASVVMTGSGTKTSVHDFIRMCPATVTSTTLKAAAVGLHQQSLAEKTTDLVRDVV